MKSRNVWMTTGAALASLALFPVWGCLHHAQVARQNDKPAASQTPVAVATSRTSTKASTAATHPTHIAFSKLGIQLGYPSLWKPSESKDYELLLSRSAGPDVSVTPPIISLDVPDLPPHIPGMIPIGLVKGGYLDDLKKEVGKSVPATREEPKAIEGAQGRMVHSTWKDSEGRDCVETALVLVHGDHVYILRARFEKYDTLTPNDFEAIVKSIRWGK